MSSIIGKFLTVLGIKRREANILVVGLDNSGKSTILNFLKRKDDQVEEVVPTVGFTVERLTAVNRNKSGIQLIAFDMSGQGKYRNLWEHYYNNVEGIIFVIDSTDALRLVVARDELDMMLNFANNNNASISGGDTRPVVGGDNSFNTDDSKNRSNGNYNNQDEFNHGIPTQQTTRMQPPPSTASSTRNTFVRSSSKTSLNTNNEMKQSNSINSLRQSGNQPFALNTNQQQFFKRPDIPILFFANKMDLKDALPSVKISQMLGLQTLPHRNWHIQASNALTGEGIQDGIEWLIFQIANSGKTGTSGSGNVLAK